MIEIVKRGSRNSPFFMFRSDGQWLRYGMELAEFEDKILLTFSNYLSIEFFLLFLSEISCKYK